MLSLAEILLVASLFVRSHAQQFKGHNALDARRSDQLLRYIFDKEPSAANFDLDLATLGKTNAHHECPERVAARRLQPSAGYGTKVYTIASASIDGSAKYWEVKGADCKERVNMGGHQGSVYDVAFSPDGKKLATAGSDEAVKIWTAGKKGPALASLKDTDRSSFMHNVIWTKDGTKVISTSINKVIVWDVSGGASSSWTKKHTLTGHTAPVYSLAISADGKKLATGANNKIAKVWDITSPDPTQWKELKTIEGAKACIHGVAFSPNGKKLATASWDKRARVWDIKDDDPSKWKELMVLEGHSDALYGCVFSPDNTKLATASKDKTTKIWNVSDADPEQWYEQFALTGHHDAVLGVAWSADGELIGTASKDRTAIIWRGDDDSEGSQLCMFGGYGSGHGQEVYQIKFEPDISAAAPPPAPAPAPAAPCPMGD